MRSLLLVALLAGPVLGQTITPRSGYPAGASTLEYRAASSAKIVDISKVSPPEVPVKDLFVGVGPVKILQVGSTGAPSHPPVDVDEACVVSPLCGDAVGTAETAPSYEEINVMGDLARAWIRLNVWRKRVPVYWNPEVAGNLPWMAPPSSPVAPYPWNPPVKFCSHKLYIWSQVAGKTGFHCTYGICLKDRVVTSLIDPSYVRYAASFDICQSWTFWRFGLQSAPWVDGAIVAECAAFVMQSMGLPVPLGSGRTTALEAKTPEPKKELK